MVAREEVIHAWHILCSVALSGVNGYHHQASTGVCARSVVWLDRRPYSFPSGHATAVIALVISLVPGSDDDAQAPYHATCCGSPQSLSSRSLR